jgi:hypothetical protein
MRARDIPLDRFVNAQHEMVDRCRREGVEPPDVLAIAKANAKRIERDAPEYIGGT